jgi:hypothetical protein
MLFFFKKNMDTKTMQLVSLRLRASHPFQSSFSWRLQQTFDLALEARACKQYIQTERILISCGD